MKKAIFIAVNVIVIAIGGVASVWLSSMVLLKPYHVVDGELIGVNWLESENIFPCEVNFSINHSASSKEEESAYNLNMRRSCFLGTKLDISIKAKKATGRTGDSMMQTDWLGSKVQVSQDGVTKTYIDEAEANKELPADIRFLLKNTIQHYRTKRAHLIKKGLVK